MSFLNPVNEPVLRFKSTDVGAPQINYNSRTVGDVKAVLKACLVNGYGTKASAGWTAVNDVGSGIEFVSPAVAMVDYRLAINDTSLSSTIWSYYFQEGEKKLANGSISRGFGSIVKTDVRNGWQLLVTDRAIVFVEFAVSYYLDKTFARITYWGSLKPAVTEVGENISFLSVGYEASPDEPPYRTISTASNGYRHISISGRNNPRTEASNMVSYSSAAAYGGNSQVAFTSELYLFNGSEFVGSHPAILLNTPKAVEDAYGVFDASLAGRPVLHVCTTQKKYTVSDLNNHARVILIPLDYWEF